MFKSGFRATGVVYKCDETVIITKGEIRVTDDSGTTTLGTGDVYHGRAGTGYSVEAIQDGEAICVFSRSAYGDMPEDE